MSALASKLSLWMTGATATTTTIREMVKKLHRQLSQLRGAEAGIAMDISSPVMKGGIRPTPSSSQSWRYSQGAAQAHRGTQR